MPAAGRRARHTRSNGSTRWRITQRSRHEKRVCACSSARLATSRASTEKAAFTGLAYTG